jgi:hypothetical protein
MSAVRESTGPRPYRLVDARSSGWHLVGGGRFATPLEPETWEYARIIAERGPVREVIEPAELDVLIVQTALEQAGQLAAGSLTVALHQVVAQHESSDPLVAGDPESWQSDTLKWVACQTGRRLVGRPPRWNSDVVEVLAEVIWAWTRRDSPVYVEVVGNLAQVFGSVAVAGGGWEAVSDPWMQPAWHRSGHGVGDDLDEVDALRHYLMSSAGVPQP